MEDEDIKIYSVGDSHSWHCWLKFPWAKHLCLGPMTMHLFGESKPIVTAKLPRKDIPVIFCYGEIDCRYHVFRHQPWKKTIDTLVENYLKALDNNSKVNPNIWIFNVVPPPRRDHLDNPAGNTTFPFYGSDNERLSYVKRMNDLLRAQTKYPFINVYKEYCDEDGFLNMKQSDGHVHISDEKPLMKAVADKLGIQVPECPKKSP